MSNKATWVKSVPQVNEWAETLKPSTRRTYEDHLFQYWQNYLSVKYASVKDWIDQVKGEQKYDEKNVVNHWALELKHFLDNYKSRYTQRNIGYNDKWLYAAAVVGVLNFFLTREVSYPFKIEQTVEEIKSSKRMAMSPAEVISLYKSARTPRDRAMALVMVNGVAPNEMAQLATSWHDWFKPDMKAPFHIEVVREKKRFDYHITLFEDAVDGLLTLYNARLQEKGTVEELFENIRTAEDVERVIGDLRERAGLKEKMEKWGSQRVRAHGFRHFFETQGRLLGADSAVIQFATGHRPAKGDQYNYDKSSLEAQWVEIVDRELTKMKPVLNIVTGRAQTILKDKETEIRIKAIREFYNTQVKAGIIKPEAMDIKTLEIVCKAVGIEVHQLLQMADTETNKRMALFDVLAKAIDLDDATYNKYMEALRVMKPTNAKAAWENTDNYWMRVEVGTDDYMQALADHFIVEDKEGAMRILRKPKTVA